MPIFEYQGVEKTGKRTSGQIDAQSEGDVRVYLRNQGIRPITLKKQGVLTQDLGQLIKSSKRSISTETLIALTRQLHALITSGIPLVQGLEFLAEQSGTQNLKTIMTVIKDKVSQGSFLWEALSHYPKIFPKFYIALVRVGESSGSLDIMFKRLSRYLENTNRLKKIVKSALLYPAMVMTLGVGVIILMLVFVIPKFEELLKSTNQALPGPTQIIINFSHFIGNNFVYLLAAIGSLVYVSSLYLKTREGKALVDKTIFNAPLFGPLIQKAAISRFSRTLQIMLSSGINLIDAIDICKSTMDNIVLEDAISKVRREIEAGKTLGSVITKLQVFPKMSVQMITVGEASGNLDQMLEKVSDFYEEEVEITINGLTKLIEPLLIVVLGGIVGAIMIAMYLPVFQIAGGAVGS